MIPHSCFWWHVCAVFRREMEREMLQLKLIKLNSMMSTKVRSTVNQWDINIHNLSNSRSNYIVCGELRLLSHGIKNTASFCYH